MMMAVFATSSLNSIHHWKQISNHQTFLIVTATPAVEKKNDLDVTFDHRCFFYVAAIASQAVFSYSGCKSVKLHRSCCSNTRGNAVFTREVEL